MFLRGEIERGKEGDFARRVNVGVGEYLIVFRYHGSNPLRMPRLPAGVKNNERPINVPDTCVSARLGRYTSAKLRGRIARESRS